MNRSIDNLVDVCVHTRVRARDCDLNRRVARCVHARAVHCAIGTCSISTMKIMRLTMSKQAPEFI
jgi:hypothetical protein